MARCSFISNGRTFTLDVVETSYSIENNTSDVNWTLTISDGGTTWYDSYAKATVDDQVVYNETKSWSTGEFPAKDGSVSGTVSGIKHDSEGKKSISFALEGYSYAYSVKYADGTLELTKIPRASKITCPSFNIGDSTVVNIERYGSNFTDTIKWEFGDLSGTLATKTSNPSVGFTPNKANFYAQIPNARSGTGTITCQTYSGDTLIGTSTCQFTAYAVEEKPTVSATIIDTNSTTINLTGDSSIIVKYMSKPRITISAEAKNSAEIASYSLTAGDGQSSTTRVTTLTNGIGSNKYTVGATDTRDYSQTVTNTISNFVNYVKCAFVKKDVYRTESASTEILCDIAGNYFNGSFGNSSNNLTLTYRYREKEGTWSSYSTITPTITNNTFKYSASLGSSFDIEKEYEFEFNAADELTSDTLNKSVEKGTGVVEIGEDLVNINGTLTENDNIVGGYAIGDILITMNPSSPSVRFPGTTWQRVTPTSALAIYNWWRRTK